VVQFCDVSRDNREVVLADESGRVQIVSLRMPHEVLQEQPVAQPVSG
jgi:hypothetical protein